MSQKAGVIMNNNFNSCIRMCFVKQDERNTPKWNKVIKSQWLPSEILKRVQNNFQKLTFPYSVIKSIFPASHMSILLLFCFWWHDNKVVHCSFKLHAYGILITLHVRENVLLFQPSFEFPLAGEATCHHRTIPECPWLNSVKVSFCYPSPVKVRRGRRGMWACFALHSCSGSQASSICGLCLL